MSLDLSIINVDETVINPKTVMPAKAGIPDILKIPDERYASFHVRIMSGMTKKENSTLSLRTLGEKLELAVMLTVSYKKPKCYGI